MGPPVELGVGSAVGVEPGMELGVVLCCGMKETCCVKRSAVLVKGEGGGEGRRTEENGGEAFISCHLRFWKGSDQANLGKMAGAVADRA